MKPREFDDLVRQKFDENGFEYNPGNWARLEEQLDGRSKKRSIMMWWWIPVSGIAASVALAVGFTSMWRQAETGNAGVGQFAKAFHYEQKQPLQEPQVAAQYATITVKHTEKKKKTTNPIVANNDHFGISLQNALGYTPAKSEKQFNLLDAIDPLTKNKEKKKEVAVAIGFNTFKPELPNKKSPKLSILLSGGVNQGNISSGFVAGASIRKWVTDKVYIESDVAYNSSNNTTSQQDMVARTVYAKAARSSAAVAKTTLTTSASVESQKTVYDPKEQTDNFNMSYAQLTPSLGVQVFKKLSIAAGPDFQQALADNRPTTPAGEQSFNNVAVMPLFDIGMVAKTEYSVTRRIKAQVSYRKGINNILTPEDKYIDRNYLQVQVRCAIFNK